MTTVNVVLVVPNHMAARTVFETPVLEKLAAGSLNIYVLSPSNDEKKKLQQKGIENVSWRSLYQPTIQTLSTAKRLGKLCRSVCVRVTRFCRAEFGNLVYRFNELNAFAGHMQKKQMSDSRREREALAGNHVEEGLGLPFPNSMVMYKILYAVYYGRWQCTNQSIAAFYEEAAPELIVLWNLQNAQTKDFMVAARKKKIPMLAVISSWDMPTTKGPIGPGIDRYVVNSAAMKNELVKFHHIEPGRVEVTGWPQMDYYSKAEITGKKDFMEQIGIDAGGKLIVFAANSERLGVHEPSIVEYIAQRVGGDDYSCPCTLLVRPHPKDTRWKERFNSVIGAKNVIVQSAEMGRLDYLRNLVKHASVVVASQGSIAMDAIALDTCVVNVGFDGAIDVDETESVRRWYEMDHYKMVLDTGGAWLVVNFDEMNIAINAYLDDPELHSKQRQSTRKQQLEPMDGQASRRITDIIETMASGRYVPTVNESMNSTISV